MISIDTAHAVIDRPEGAVRGYALFAHCFACSAKSPAAVRISRRLTEVGYTVLRLDFSETDFTSNIRDLHQAATWMRENIGAPDLLIGHSLGGAAALAAAGDIEGLSGVVSIAAPFDPGHVLNLFATDAETIRQQGRAEVSLGGKTLELDRDFLEDICGQRQEERLRDLRVPLLVLHSPQDEVVDIGNAQSIYRAAHQPKSFISLDGADHLLLGAGQAAYAADVIAAWAGRYVAEKTPTAAVAFPAPGSEFTTQIHAGNHTILADEPTSVAGAADLGPNPFDLLKASLVACTSMTMGMYARRKGFDQGNTRVSVEVEQRRWEEGLLTTMRRVIHFDPTLTEQQRAGLLRIADKCPVHRLLEGTVNIETTALATGE